MGRGGERGIRDVELCMLGERSREYVVVPVA